MSLFPILLLVHVLGATVWTGGHLVLCLSVLPAALRAGDPEPVQRFEAAYERIGMAALALQVASGLGLAYMLLPDVTAWLGGSPVARLVHVKLGLLAATVALALHARLRVLPRLDAARLPMLGAHIVGVTLLAVLFVAAGLGLRTGWLA